MLRERNTLTDDDDDCTSCGKCVERSFHLGREIP